MTEDVLAKLAALGENGPDPCTGMSPVTKSRDLIRVLGLPVSEGPQDPDLEEAVKRPTGTMRLRPLQLEALTEFRDQRGLLGLLPVGSGKTLVGALAPTVADADGAVYFTKAGEKRALLKQVQAALNEYREHWRILPEEDFPVLSYGQLSAKSGTDLLEELEPDVIVLDEAQALGDPTAARTKRFLRYMREHPETDLLVMSGSLLTKSLMNLGHLAKATLYEGSPLPLHWPTLSQWATALDPGGERSPGALQAFVHAHGGSSVRDAFRRRFVSCPGVVATEKESVALPLTHHLLEVPDVCQAEIAQLQNEWRLPDGTELVRAPEFNRNRNALRIGYFYRWEWPNAEVDYDWLEAYRGLGRAITGFLRSSSRQGLDSPGLVLDALEAGPGHGLPGHLVSAFEQWTSVDVPSRGPTPRVEPVRAEALRVAKKIRAAFHRGLILCDVPAFGRLLAKEYKVTYGSTDGEVCVGSLQGMGTGRDDLKKYSRLLMATATPNPGTWEQAIGRIHRPGQTADHVEVWRLSCYEGFFVRAKMDARALVELTGAPQKILGEQVPNRDPGPVSGFRPLSEPFRRPRF